MQVVHKASAIWELSFAHRHFFIFELTFGRYLNLQEVKLLLGLTDFTKFLRLTQTFVNYRSLLSSSLMNWR